MGLVADYDLEDLDLSVQVGWGGWQLVVEAMLGLVGGGYVLTPSARRKKAQARPAAIRPAGPVRRGVN